MQMLKILKVALEHPKQHIDALKRQRNEAMADFKNKTASLLGVASERAKGWWAGRVGERAKGQPRVLEARPRKLENCVWTL